MVEDARRGEWFSVAEMQDEGENLVLPRLKVLHRLATDREKEEHLRTGILRTIRSMQPWNAPDSPFNGLPIIGRPGSGIFILYDENDGRNWHFAVQRANFRDEGPVTFYTALDRPLRAATVIPADLHFKWNLHERCE